MSFSVRVWYAALHNSLTTGATLKAHSSVSSQIWLSGLGHATLMVSGEGTPDPRGNRGETGEGVDPSLT